MNRIVGIGLIIGIAVVGALYVGLRTTPPNQPAMDTTENNESTEVIVEEQSDFITIAENVATVPVAHASAVVRWGEQLIFIDPVGEAAQYRRYGEPDLVMITHRHGDHFDPENLPDLVTGNTVLITNQDVADQLPESLAATVVVTAPGESATYGPLTLETIPAYNLREEAQQYHPRERGDLGLILSDGTTRVYFSGDTEDIPEMRALTDIDAAFVSMNLPYTMDVDAAADGVLAFAPKTVYPYHFRTPDGFSDLERFAALVTEGNPEIAVVVLDWYSEEEDEKEAGG